MESLDAEIIKITSDMSKLQDRYDKPADRLKIKRAYITISFYEAKRIYSIHWFRKILQELQHPASIYE